MKTSNWAGKASDYPTHLEISLGFEGLRKRDLLKAAGYASLREWVDQQVIDTKQGHRTDPTKS